MKTFVGVGVWVNVMLAVTVVSEYVGRGSTSEMTVVMRAMMNRMSPDITAVRDSCCEGCLL